ncbi:MAG: molybdenum cofactor guanylyltransferase [Anaerolineales bacterium]|nr:MAG: molybdenum cofactor guanylyltransferase [Anaerolineales bacterium]
MEEFSVAILAGGQSRRMGQDKAFLPVGGRPVIERVLERVTPLSDDLMLVVDVPMKYGHLGQRMVVDVLPGKGALGGIYTSIHAARHQHCLVVACDMPFLNADLLDHMASLAIGFDVVIPRIKEFPETMHALYGKRCLQPIRGCLEVGRLKIVSFFDQVRIRYVERDDVARFDPDFRSFLNMNTPADWARLRELAEGE